MEADPRHAELVVRELGLERATPSKVSGVKPTSKDGEPAQDDLSREEAKQYRAIAAILKYLAPDRLDIAFSVKEAARNMAKPRRSDFDKLKRIGRYLLGRPRLISKYAWQRDCGTVTAYTDSDWAGCAAACKSTSGGIVMYGSHVLKSYSKQQRTVALSSAEAELHALVAASAETLGMIGLMTDMGCKIGGEVYCDSSAALGIAQRQGMGKLWHVRTQALWVQEARLEGRLNYKKVLGSRNPADSLTKYMTSILLEQHLETVGLKSRDVRAETAPELNIISPLTATIINKRVRISGMLGMKRIPAIGKGESI